MADLSEMSVVLALRDWQWRRAKLVGAEPKPAVGLSGNAEKKVGDNLTDINDRLFIFEVKAKRSNINDEWTRPQVKHALSRLETLGTSFVVRNQEEMSVDDALRFHQSLQCHHFAFWAPDFKRRPKNFETGRPVPGALYLTPYFLGVMHRFNSNCWKLIRSDFKRAYGLGHSFPSLTTDPPDSIRYVYDTESKLDEVGDQKTKLISRFETPHTWSELGLPLKEFSEYIGYLCGDEKQQETINVVIMDRNGKFFAHITSTNDLRSIFEPKDPDPEWSNSLEGKASMEQSQLDLTILETAESKKNELNHKHVHKGFTPN
ncbi:hypothetical protein [Xanthomonas arboricola]|uniref:hypothetical protein n=1 Tax=Xanthomonas arboricola TaxID=56448 RepID=UPI000AD82740|nr:hypothetical protein [Xanthomonas arboricola]